MTMICLSAHQRLDCFHPTSSVSTTSNIRCCSMCPRRICGSRWVFLVGASSREVVILCVWLAMRTRLTVCVKRTSLVLSLRSLRSTLMTSSHLASKIDLLGSCFSCAIPPQLRPRIPPSCTPASRGCDKFRVKWLRSGGPLDFRRLQLPTASLHRVGLRDCIGDSLEYACAIDGAGSSRLSNERRFELVPCVGCLESMLLKSCAKESANQFIVSMRANSSGARHVLALPPSPMPSIRWGQIVGKVLLEAKFCVEPLTTTNMRARARPSNPNMKAKSDNDVDERR